MFRGTGKRKTSVARVILDANIKGITVNGRDLKEYFPREAHVSEVLRPLKVTEKIDKIGAKILVNGGGLTGQAEAIRHGIARALLEVNPSLRALLKPKKLLVRDARKVERKKPGLKKARRSPQFSKR